MIRAPRQPSPAWRQVFMTLATLALVVKVLIPAGFMAATSSQTAPFAIVLCTGQGPVAIQRGEAIPVQGDHGGAPAKAGHDSPCLFAGHGAASAAPDMAQAGVAQFVSYRSPLPSAPSVLPGRGLAAPPPPSTGPPSII